MLTTIFHQEDKRLRFKWWTNTTKKNLLATATITSTGQLYPLTYSRPVTSSSLYYFNTWQPEKDQLVQLKESTHHAKAPEYETCPNNSVL